MPHLTYSEVWAEASNRAGNGQVCAIGGVDDGTLRICCASHDKLLCAHHYARSHFVETMPSYAAEWACNA